MEPGHEDRENPETALTPDISLSPQWSPVTRTGKTTACPGTALYAYVPQWSPVTRTGKTTLAGFPVSVLVAPQWSPVTRTGKTPPSLVILCRVIGRNGARSRGPGKLPTR